MPEKELILKKCKLPALPHVALKVLQVVNNPNTKIADLHHLISRDQAMASRLLMIANSAYYGLPRKVETISDAILLLGFDTVKNIAVAVATKDLYKTKSLIGQKLWEHALGVSVASGIICKFQKINNEISPEEALVAGLLHDIGKTVINNNYPEMYEAVFEMVYNDKVPFIKAEEEILGYNHQQVGELLFSEWGFSDEMVEIVAKHHRRHEIDDINLKTLCTIVAFSDCLNARLGVGYAEPMITLCEDEAEFMEYFDFGIEEVEAIIEEFKARFVLEKLEFLG